MQADVDRVVPPARPAGPAVAAPENTSPPGPPRPLLWSWRPQRPRRAALRGERRRTGPWAAGLTAAALALAVGPLAACDQLSDETKDAGVIVACQQIEVDPGTIAENPEEARLVALIIRDLAPDDRISEIADIVADDPTLVSPRAQLAEWVDDKCGR
ncbi:MAG: hypothetical protein IRZ08_17165 [Frankia sp.]|nr:hypothetical protein [Frankia sp.]